MEAPQVFGVGTVNKPREVVSIGVTPFSGDHRLPTAQLGNRAMSLVAQQQSVPVGSTASVLKPRVGQNNAKTTIQCLILSGSQERQEMLSRAAEKAGWDTIVCGDVSQAWAKVHRHRFEMAMIDMTETPDVGGFKDVAEHMSSSQPALLVVCGEEGNALEEIWARQLGAWLYLPGVSEESDMSGLCEEALPVVEKMTGKSLVAQQ